MEPYQALCSKEACSRERIPFLQPQPVLSLAFLSSSLLKDSLLVSCSGNHLQASEPWQLMMIELALGDIVGLSACLPARSGTCAAPPSTSCVE